MIDYKLSVKTDYAKVSAVFTDTSRNDKLELKYSLAGVYGDTVTWSLGE